MSERPKVKPVKTSESDRACDSDFNSPLGRSVRMESQGEFVRFALPGLF
jgi:hypothetical protein